MAARDAYRTGEIITGIGQALLAIVVTVLSLSLRLVWDFGVVIPFYHVFLALYVVIGIDIGLNHGIKGVFASCKRRFNEWMLEFKQSLSTEGSSPLVLISVLINDWRDVARNPTNAISIHAVLAFPNNLRLSNFEINVTKQLSAEADRFCGGLKVPLPAKAFLNRL